TYRPPSLVYQTLRFSPTAPILGLYISDPTAPANLWMLNVATGACWSLTQTFHGGIPATEMVPPELVHFVSFDGRQIPAWWYRPKAASPTAPVPAIVAIHGGPELQSQPIYEWSGICQYLAQHGIGVLVPNIRGSTGYGKTYQQLIYHD